jgi:hypothetical protein
VCEATLNESRALNPRIEVSENSVFREQRVGMSNRNPCGADLVTTNAAWLRSLMLRLPVVPNVLPTVKAEAVGEDGGTRSLYPS